MFNFHPHLDIITHSKNNNNGICENKAAKSGTSLNCSLD